MRATNDSEDDPALKDQKVHLVRLLTLHFDPSSDARVAAIDSFGADIRLDLRDALTSCSPPAARPLSPHPRSNITRALRLGADIPENEAYAPPVAATHDEATAALAAAKFYDLYAEPDPAVASAARAGLTHIGTGGRHRNADRRLRPGDPPPEGP